MRAPARYNKAGKEGEGDTAILFSSDESPKAILDRLEAMERRGVALKFRRCASGRNGLDFQLSSELGYLFGTGAGKEFYILSDDTGYDVLREYWAPSGASVSRTGTRSVPEPEPATPEGPSIEEARRATAAWLDAPMTQARLRRSERNHVLGCARACMTKRRDPDDRMALFRSDTLRIRGRSFMESLERDIGPALRGLFASDAN